ncbi:hypothetical protein SEA_YARA_73 [Streptomyces phage Yara]|nr:hypothetical protein SEA_YARA_73 [Streptomyces phage Yara]
MTDKMMDRVQALLNKAESTDSEAEAQTYREAAERIMKKYQIDEAMLAHARMAEGIDDKPDTRRITFADSFSPLIEQLFSLACSTAEHTGCEFLGFWSGEGYMVGYEKDLDYAEMMYASIRLQLLQRVDPKANPHKGYDENVYTLHEAGIKWQSIAHMMEQARYNAPVGSLAESWPVTPWEVDGQGKGKKDGGRLIRAAKRHCRDNGLEYVAIADPKKFRRSYAEGFVGEIRARLYDLERVGKEVRDTAGSGAELALVGRKDRVRKAMEDLEMLHGIHKSQRKEETGGRKKKYTAPKTDWSAYDRGSQDGKRADLGRRAGDIGDGRKAALEG